MAYEASNAVQFGAIASHHLAVVHTRRQNPFEVPEDNTTTQAIELDRQREAIQRQEDAQEPSAQTAVVKIRLNGLWMPVEVDYLSLRRAIGLPDHDIFSRGIFHDFTSSQPTNAVMEDEDHQEDDLMGELKTPTRRQVNYAIPERSQLQLSAYRSREYTGAFYFYI